MTLFKIKKFTYSSCSIINISINTHENNSCPRGEIGRHKGLKTKTDTTLNRPRQTYSDKTPGDLD